MNRRLAMIAILLLTLATSAVTVLARQATFDDNARTALPNRLAQPAEMGREMSALRARGGDNSGRMASERGSLLGLVLGAQDANDNSDDNANDNSDDNANDNDDDNANDNGDDNANGNDDDDDDDDDGNDDDDDDDDDGNDDDDDNDNDDDDDGYDD